ncbi:putative cytochrome c heme lyase protein [Neofusicoccum parvum UCRNP2]|uniref:Holocytochrome c-type synthase n=1 Tax=Botryosphaeria parva (strain UCR-NP2) TaxID=1287680 RepID=R1EFH8_BOTPV|nr:putative cytochrome c heme lyase protein [Neofusicoccum parvum UCRNP2]
MKHHEFEKLSRPAPRLCRNANCGRTLDGASKTGDTRASTRMGQGPGNDIGLCSVCFGPLYVSMYDPEGKALRRRVERRYLTQLLSGCGKSWCRNEMCKTGRQNAGIEPAGLSSKEALPLIKPHLEKLQPGCPMHQKGAAPPASPPQAAPVPAGACPYVPPEKKNDGSSTSAAPPKSGLLEKLNPLNFMPSNLSQDRAAHQTLDLPTEREPSSIPRGDGGGNWEYPSPQQMYNAMLRKGYTDTPQDAVESMVAVHNFLNEGAWAEILEWERRFGQGLAHGWRASARGEEGSLAGELLERWPDADSQPPRLVRFMGRPGELTPKARMMQFLGQVWPSQFSAEPPFDRHDWFVQRQVPGGDVVERRYVIDYYEGEPEHESKIAHLMSFS